MNLIGENSRPYQIFLMTHTETNVRFFQTGICYENLATTLDFPIEVANEFECKIHCFKNPQCTIFTITTRTSLKTWCTIYPRLDYSEWKARAINISDCLSFYLEEYSNMISLREGIPSF